MGLNDPRALGRELDTKEAPDPYDNTKAERFMTTLKVEAIYLATAETFEDIADDVPRSINGFALHEGCIPPSDT